MHPIDVVEMFKQAAFEVDNRRLTDLRAETVISTLGMDSVAVMELVSYFEEKIGIRIPDEDLAKVRTAIVDAGLEVADAELQYVAKNLIEIDDSEVAGKVLKVLDALDDLDDVVNVHTNADITADIQ